MKKVLDLIDSVGKVGFFASAEDNQPRVRPFGFAFYEDGKFWFCTNNTKKVYRQLKETPYAEVIFCKPNYSQYVRVSGHVVLNTALEAKTRVMEAMPGVKGLYKSPDNPIFEVFYLEKGTAVLEAFPPTAPAEEFRF